MVAFGFIAGNSDDGFVPDRDAYAVRQLLLIRWMSNKEVVS